MDLVRVKWDPSASVQLLYFKTTKYVLFIIIIMIIIIIIIDIDTNKTVYSGKPTWCENPEYQHVRIQLGTGHTYISIIVPPLPADFVDCLKDEELSMSCFVSLLYDVRMQMPRLPALQQPSKPGTMLA